MYKMEVNFKNFAASEFSGKWMTVLVLKCNFELTLI